MKMGWISEVMANSKDTEDYTTKYGPKFIDALNILQDNFSPESLANYTQVTNTFPKVIKEVAQSWLEDHFHAVAYDELQNCVDLLRKNQFKDDGSGMMFNDFKYGNNVYNKRSEFVEAVISNRKKIPKFSEGAVDYAEKILRLAAKYGQKAEESALEKYLTYGTKAILDRKDNDAANLVEIVDLALKADIISDGYADLYKLDIKQAFDERFNSNREASEIQYAAGVGLSEETRDDFERALRGEPRKDKPRNKKPEPNKDCYFSD